AGAVLLLSTPPSAFERIVPALIALGSIVLLLRDPIRRWADRRAAPPPVFALAAAITLIGVYAGYFAAAVLYAIIAPVHWPAAILLGCGCLAGSWTGPAVVRRLPERPLRAVVG